VFGGGRSSSYHYNNNKRSYHLPKQFRVTASTV
jgi:hypothetical protein